MGGLCLLVELHQEIDKETREFPKKSRNSKNRITFLVLCLYENTGPGHGPCLADTIQNGSKEIFSGPVLECLVGTGSHEFAIFLCIYPYLDTLIYS